MKVKPGSPKNLVDGLKGVIRKEIQNHYRTLTLDALGAPSIRNKNKKNPSIAQRRRYLINEKRRLRKAIGNLVSECKDYCSRTEKALLLAKNKNCPPEVIAAIQEILDTPKRIPPRKQKF